MQNIESKVSSLIKCFSRYAIGKEDIREVPEILTKLSNIHKSILIYICKVGD